MVHTPLQYPPCTLRQSPGDLSLFYQSKHTSVSRGHTIQSTPSFPLEDMASVRPHLDGEYTISTWNYIFVRATAGMLVIR